ncbi:EpsG family protein [Kosakonia sacchari]|uniref:EpsG family protein n=1 Tax=Kosakonia sacchari TaxID=1158459 RepID=UPI001585102A|nr:EpsG family protein [Kosakonia sacchari]MDN2486125.1 EpsG family protein [Kosakonia sacchari]NUL38648.1 EpsG family protein [Kosakonia sacchari]
MIYTIGYIYSTFFYLLFFRHVKSKNLYYLASLVPIIIVLIRGFTGVDTVSYIYIFDQISAGYDANVEVGFYWLTRFMLTFTSDGLLILKVYAVVMFYFFATFFGKTPERASVYILLVMPLFFYDMYMNGIRYGLAYSIALVAYDQKLKSNNLLFVFFAILAFSFHVSSLIFLGLLFANYLKYLNLKSVTAITLLVGLFIYFFRDRVIVKLAQYSDIGSPEPLSGLMPLIIFLAVLLLVFVSAKKQPSFLLVFVLCVAELCAFVLSRYTYMGMRIQFIVILAFFCKLPEIILFKKQAIVLMLFISLLCFAGRYRNMVNEYGVGPSPFLPYQYYWDVSPSNINFI